MKRIFVFISYLILLLSVTTTHADNIEAALPGGLIAQADYYQGDADKPAILLLHGFLTVHTFNLIKNITEELAGNRYSVLSPTLTLGISKRKTTLECTALHLHSMDSDLKEIEWWVNWLIAKGHPKIILMGHSSGALQIMQYASTQKHKEIVKLIGLSVIPLSNRNNNQFMVSSKKATQMINSGNKEIQNFNLSYCIDNYAAPAREYMSYARLDTAHILQTLRAIQIDKIIINGSDDVTVYAGWFDDLKRTGTELTIINGADHFFGNGTEFELYDRITQAIDNE